MASIDEKFAKFQLTIPAHRGGDAKIIVNEQDVTNQVHHVAMYAGVDHVTTLQVHMHGQGTIEGEGVVEVHTHTKQGVKDWIRSLNAAAIDQEALNRSSWADSGTLTEKVLAILLEKLDEDSPPEDQNNR